MSRRVSFIVPEKSGPTREQREIEKIQRKRERMLEKMRNQGFALVEDSEPDRKWEDFKKPGKEIKKGKFSAEEIEKLLISLVNYCKRQDMTESRKKVFYIRTYQNG